MFKITGEEDTNNSDVDVDDAELEGEGNGTLQSKLNMGSATDFLDLSNKELIDILKNDPDPNERELADGALQERANEQR